ncbi:MAG: hypothetical protein JJ878_20885 [Alphaproteobacteria bacterium]|nr:hypothetical protein [Alphaproteobacteria bacterium]MBO6865089.1 hypothetical protein [Alphaproteobacteria bacterium]
MRRQALSLALATVLTGLIAGCTSNGEIDNPVQRRATWFSFLSGDDIAAECEASGRERYRLTYIADREIQVRIYDIDADMPPKPQLRTRVMQVAASEWFPLPVLEDPSRPFRPYDTVTTLSEEDMTAIRDDLLNAGWSTQPPPIGRKIASHSYAWLVAGCRDGAFSFQVWEYPDAEFDALAFPAVLFAAENSGIDVVPPPTDGERRTFDRFMGRTGDNMPSDGRELYNMQVVPRGVILVN